MKKTIRKDIDRRKLFSKYELKRRILKKIIQSIHNGPNIQSRLEIQFQLNELPRNSSIVRIRNRCTLTGRGRSINRQYRLSRIKFREFALDGLIPGVRKSSW